MMGRRASLFDIGVYAGGAVTSNWYSSRMFRADGLTRAEPNLMLTAVGEEADYGIGLTSAFGGMITFWGLPWFGLRVHYAYVPSELPTRRDGTGDLFGGGSEEFDDGLPLNNHFYDLNRVFRFSNLPLFSRIASNAYLFVGGGGLTSDPASSALESRLGVDANETLVCQKPFWGSRSGTPRPHGLSTRRDRRSGLVRCQAGPGFCSARSGSFLRSVLGTQAVAKPQFDFAAGGMFDPFRNFAQFLVLSQGSEDLGVRAYKGQARELINNKPIFTAALTMHSVEARHASKVRRVRGEVANMPEQAPFKGWITLRGVDAAAMPIQPVYQAGTPPAMYPPEENMTQLGVNVSTLTTPGITIMTQAASEAFDEPLDRDTVISIAQPFIVTSPLPPL